MMRLIFMCHWDILYSLVILIFMYVMYVCIYHTLILQARLIFLSMKALSNTNYRLYFCNVAFYSYLISSTVITEIYLGIYMFLPRRKNIGEKNIILKVLVEFLVNIWYQIVFFSNELNISLHKIVPSQTFGSVLHFLTTTTTKPISTSKQRLNVKTFSFETNTEKMNKYPQGLLGKSSWHYKKESLERVPPSG